MVEETSKKTKHCYNDDLQYIITKQHKRTQLQNKNIISICMNKEQSWHHFYVHQENSNHFPTPTTHAQTIWLMHVHYVYTDPPQCTSADM